MIPNNVLTNIYHPVVDGGIEKHQEKIKELVGDKEFTYLDNGSYAYVFDLGDDTVARISCNEPEDLPNVPEINQRLWATAISDNLFFEVFPKLLPNDDASSVAALQKALTKKHIDFWDTQHKNVGKDKDGNYKVLDPGSFSVKDEYYD